MKMKIIALMVNLVGGGLCLGLALAYLARHGFDPYFLIIVSCTIFNFILAYRNYPRKELEKLNENV